MVDDDTSYQVAGTRLLRYSDQKSLKPFIYKEKDKDHYNPVDCYQGDKKVNEYKYMEWRQPKEQGATK